jgi:acetolactate synthase-1/2/3 large subunit
MISEHLDNDAIIVPGSSGMCSEVTMQAIRVKKGQRILNNQGFGAMGFGLPASIGVCLASGSKPVVCINGDGGFQLNIQELETVARLKLPIKFFILNNEGYGSITNTQRNYFDGFYVASEKSSGLTLPDICRLACAYGLPSIRIQNHDQLKEHIADILGSDGPIICDVVIDPLQIARPRMSSAKLEDGAMISKPLEDLWPFLDRQEFTSNMLE